MPVNLSMPESFIPVSGAKLATVKAGIRYKGRDDLVLITLQEGTTVAATFTKNKCCAAPVLVAKEHLQECNGQVRALLINAGNANAVTGDKGLQNARASCAQVAELLGVDTSQVMPFSTGVIGEQLNMPAMQAGINNAVGHLDTEGWLQAAKGIMTTDTLPKLVSKQCEIDGEIVTITGMSKGSGMICPNMATMLAYVVTDADISKDDLDLLLHRGVNQSFNRITVDSDTSTNDALVLAATGQSKLGKLDTVAKLDTFYAALEDVLVEIATAIVRDGEGATKFVRINVADGASEQDCETIAYDVAHSPLVKTALFASDPNWGRILMAVGKSQAESLNMERLDINIGNVALIKQGQPASDYTEEAGKSVFEQSEITIDIILNTGSENYHVWTSDLSHEYVSINADYRS